jgi:hypothetical protein
VVTDGANPSGRVSINNRTMTSSRAPVGQADTSQNEVQATHNPKVAGSNPAPATREVAEESPPSREGSPVSDEMSLLGSADQLVNFGKLFVQVLVVQVLFDRA